MPAGRNGAPIPSAGSVRTAERTGGHPGERSGGARAREDRRPQARRPGPGPAGRGPYDVDDVDPGVSAAPGVLDFGALRVPLPPAGSVTVEPTANGRMQAVHVTLPGGRLSISALAAPKSSKLWPQLAKEIDASLREGGARVRSHKGEWGRELHATTGAATSVFVGVDGPRWMVYGVATGPSAQSTELEAELRRMLRGTVVVRGKSPYPVRTVLPLTTPESLVEEAAATEATPAPAPPTTPVAPPAPVPSPVEEPSWADPVQRISDTGATEVLPEDGAAATDLSTNAWPVDDHTGRPAPPEWLTGEQRVHPPAPRRRRAAVPVEEVAAALTEPILITAAHPVEEPERAVEEPAAPPTTRIPAVPPEPGAQPRTEGGIDAYYGWSRPAARPPVSPPVSPPASPPAASRPAPAEPEPASPPVAPPDRQPPDSPPAPPGPPPAPARRSPTPVDPLDPAAPVDTRWLDQPGVTTAWEAVVAERRPEPEPTPAATDWEEWARQELDRAVAERAAASRAAEEAAARAAAAAEPAAGTAGGTAAEPAAESARAAAQRAAEPRAPQPRPDGPGPDEDRPASFWERFGLEEPEGARSGRRRAGPDDAAPVAGGRRRRVDRAPDDPSVALPDALPDAPSADLPEPEQAAPGRPAHPGGIDPFTARRRSREAVRGRDPDRPTTSPLWPVGPSEPVWGSAWGAGRDAPAAPAEQPRRTAPVAPPLDAVAWSGGWPGTAGRRATGQGSVPAGSGPRAAGDRVTGRRHADAPGGGRRLSVAELAERAGQDRAGQDRTEQADDPPRGRHYRPGSASEN